MKKAIILLCILCIYNYANADIFVTSDLSSQTEATLFDIHAIQSNSWTWSVFVWKRNTWDVALYDASWALIATQPVFWCWAVPSWETTTSCSSVKDIMIKFRNWNFVYLHSATKSWSNFSGPTTWAVWLLWNWTGLQRFASNTSQRAQASNWHFLITSWWELHLRATFQTDNTGNKFRYYNVATDWSSVSTVSSAIPNETYFPLSSKFHSFFSNRLYQHTSTALRSYRYEPTLTSTQFSELSYSVEPFAYNVDFSLDWNADVNLVVSYENETNVFNSSWDLASTLSWALIYSQNQDVFTFDAFDFSPDITGFKYSAIIEGGQIRYLQDWDLYIDDDNSSSNVFDITWDLEDSNWWGWGWWAWEEYDNSVFDFDSDGDWDVSIWEFFSWVAGVFQYFWDSLINFFDNLKNLFNIFGNTFTDEVKTFSFDFIPTANAWILSDSLNNIWWEDMENTMPWRFFWFAKATMFFLVIVMWVSAFILIINHKND